MLVLHPSAYLQGPELRRNTETFGTECRVFLKTTQFDQCIPVESWRAGLKDFTLWLGQLHAIPLDTICASTCTEPLG